jgi:hypothetical protein
MMPSRRRDDTIQGMAQFSIKVDLSDIVAATQNVIDQRVMPRLSQAVSAVAQQARIDWMDGVARAKLWSGEKKPYMDSIQVEMTGPFSARVWSDYKYAVEIDTGRPARDLKRMLDSSLKVRTNKKGQRYLIIPFRHNVPGAEATGQAMPKDVYLQARQLAPSRVTGKTTRLSGTGAMGIKSRKALTVPQLKYAWGDSLPPPSTLPEGHRSRFQGMYRFDTSSGAQTRSTYLTFRVMSEASSGWVIPAKPGLFIVKGVVDRLQPLAEKAFTEGVKRDLA